MKVDFISLISNDIIAHGFSLDIPVLAVSDSETKHPTAILRLNPTKET